MNMEKRSAKHEKKLVVNSAHKSTTKFYSLEKQAMKQNLPVNLWETLTNKLTPINHKVTNNCTMKKNEESL